MRSVIEIAPSALTDIVAALSMVGVTPIASEQCEDGIRLVIEGHAVPDVPQVVCEIVKVEGERLVTLTARFIPVGTP